MKKIVIPLLLFVIIIFIGCPISNNITVDPNQEIYVPMFSLANASKSIDYEPNPNISDHYTELHGTMYLPQIAYFKKMKNSEISNSELSVKVFHQEIVGTFSYDSKNQESIYLYEIGDDGFIKVVVKADGTFDYQQGLLVNLTEYSLENMYWICDYKNCKIENTKNDIAYCTMKGQLYFGQISEKFNTQGSYIENYNLGQAKTYVHGTEKMIYGYVDPYDADSSEELTQEESFISNKSPSDVTIYEVFDKLNYIKNFNYQRDPNGYRYFNDYYYDIINDMYYGEFCYLPYLISEGTYSGPNNMDPVDFQTTTGYSYEDLGLGEIDSTIELLAKSTDVGYLFVGEGLVANWEVVNNKYRCGFEVEEDGIYLVSPSFYIIDENGNNYKDIAILKLYAGTQYYLGYSNGYDFNKAKDYSYIFYLEE